MMEPVWQLGCNSLNIKCHEVCIITSAFKRLPFKVAHHLRNIISVTLLYIELLFVTDLAALL